MIFYVPMLERSPTHFAQIFRRAVKLLTRAVAWVQSSISTVVSRPLLTMQNTNASPSDVQIKPDVERSRAPQPTPSQPTPTQDRWRQTMTLVFAISQVASSGVTVVGGIGTPVGEISDKVFTSVTAANYAFAIWGLIYSTCVAYGVYQALPAQRNNELLRRVGWWASSAFLANSLWVPVFQLEQFWLSAFIIICMMTSLAGVLRQFIEYGRKLSRAQIWLTVVPLSIFAGWISAATVLNISVALQASGWGTDLMSRSSWGMLMVLVVGVLGSYVTLLSRGNLAYGLTLVWALVGIIVAQASSSAGVAMACGVSIVAILVSLWRARVSRAPLELEPARA